MYGHVNEPLNEEEIEHFRAAIDIAVLKYDGVPPITAKRLLASYDELRQEIARHHKDFAQWEEMASKGAAVLAKWKIAERVFAKLRQADQQVPHTPHQDDILEDAFELIEQFDQVEAERNVKNHHTTT